MGFSKIRKKLSEGVLLASAACCVFAYCIFLQFIAPVFYESDSYYHIAVSSFMKNFGWHYNFHWAQFSVYKDFFADKDFLFHLSTVPFLALSNDPVIAGKFAILFYNFFFISAFIFILKKYLPSYLAACFLLLPFLSTTFTLYLTYLRSYTLANIFTFLGIYFLIKKKWPGVFFISLFYALTHTSFFTIVVFAFVCEIIRWLFYKDFFRRNIYSAVLGVILGCLIHPNFPNNLLYVHLQFLVINSANKGLDLKLGSELFSFPAARVFIENFAVLFSLNLVLWAAFFSKKRISFSTAVWFACANFYLLLALSANRHWYAVNILFFIALASYLKDLKGERPWGEFNRKINFFILGYLILILFYFPGAIKNLAGNIDRSIRLGNHYKDVSFWMKTHIPPGQLIYHNYWSDPSYFLCFNPNNDYLVVLDPFYMYHRYPELYLFYLDLSKGNVDNVYDSLNNIFKVNYGYTRKDNLFCAKVMNDPSRFNILYEDDLGIVFDLKK